MRLRRLHLAPYGRFADRSLDFGEGDRASDVTVIYGPNEAGKSTLFAAWLDLLFGIPLQTGYAFRHPRNALRIGAEIEAGDEALTLWRTGKRKESLTDADGRAVPDHRIATLLHGLDRDAYTRRFSLDDDILRQGGEEILAAKGDLGQTLYAGAGGLSGLSSALEEVGESVDAVHRKGGRATTLATGKRALDELDAVLKEARLDPRRHDGLRDTLAAAEGAREEAGRAHAAADAARALHAAASLRADLRRDLAAAEGTLAPYPDGPDLPPGAGADLAALDERLRAERAALAGAAEAARRAGAARDAETPDPDGLALAETVAGIDALRFDDGQPLRRRAESGALDIERRSAELAAVEARCAALAVEIAGADAAVADVLLPMETVEILAAALTGLRAARTDWKGAERELARARAAMGEPVAPPEGMEALARAREAWQDARRADPETLAETARIAGAAAERAALGLPDGWLDRSLPDEATVAATTEALAEAARAVEAAEEAGAEAAERLAEAEETRDALAARNDHVSDAGLADLRHARDAAWRAHRDALSAGTADAFAETLRADDAARAAHANGLELRERVRGAGETANRAQALAKRRAAALAEARDRLSAARASAVPMLDALGLPPDAPAAALAPRRSALAGAREAALAAREATRQGEVARDRLDRAAAALAALLDGEPPEDAPALAEAVKARVDALRDRERAHDAFLKARAAVATREDELEDMRRVLDMRQGALDDALHGLWCADRAPDALDALIVPARKLAAEIPVRDDLRRRVGEMRAAIDAFAAAATPLRARLGAGLAPDALMKAAANRIGTAVAIRGRIETATTSLEVARAAEAAARRAIGTAEAERAALLDGQAGDPAEPGFVARLLDRDRARTEVARLHAEIERAGAGLDPDALDAEEAALEPGRAAMLEAELEVADAAYREAIGAEALARDALSTALAGEGGAATDQERAILLMEMRESVTDAAARMIGLRAARAALDRLRRERRGPMLKHTQDAFARMTDSVWGGLETRPEGTGERLVALRGGEAVEAGGMSQGTRGQLYLSLRLAGHALFCEEAGPLPFVTDDVMETFDDARAAAALDLTARLGERGQAILLTHHRHLVDMAEARIPDLRVLDLRDG